MTVKFNDLADTTRLVALPGTFQAVVGFCEEYSQKGGPTMVVGTLAAALAGGVGKFISPIFPRGLRLNTAGEVRAANLDVQHVQVETIEVGDPDLIVSGHAGTREVLSQHFPAAAIIEGNVALSDIAGKVVAGTLPPHLVAEAAGYIPATIREFDYSRDGDLAGDELRERLVIGTAVKVTVS